MTDRSVYVIPGCVGDFVERLAGRGIDRVPDFVRCDELVVNDVAREDLNQDVSTCRRSKPTGG